MSRDGQHALWLARAIEDNRTLAVRVITKHDHGSVLTWRHPPMQTSLISLLTQKFQPLEITWFLLGRERLLLQVVRLNHLKTQWRNRELTLLWKFKCYRWPWAFALAKGIRRMTWSKDKLETFQIGGLSLPGFFPFLREKLWIGRNEDRVTCALHMLSLSTHDRVIESSMPFNSFVKVEVGTETVIENTETVSPLKSLAHWSWSSALRHSTLFSKTFFEIL